jgi:hypothetical protein
MDNKKKIVVLAAVIIVAASAGFVLWGKGKVANTPAQQKTDKENGGAESVKTHVNAYAVDGSGIKAKPTPDDIRAIPQEYISEMADDDEDGLTNAMEDKVGTKKGNADTDGDSLADGSEVTTYFTNPLKPDTDDDGFSDGDEVKRGFNPCGDGKQVFGEALAKQCVRYLKK